MALRLQYDGVKIDNIETNIDKAITSFVKSCPKTPKRIYATYTAMLAIRRCLSKITKVEAIK
jgi:lipid II isoglutaminyl synthase (glutamine-hydrolysing)